jgi:putative transposase
VHKEESISIARACRVVNYPRSQWYYKTHRDNSAVVDKLQWLSEKYRNKGFDTYYKLIRMEGLIWNRKRVLSVYRLLGLKFKKRGKRRLPARIKQPLTPAQSINSTWSMDFMSDALVGGRKIRILNVMDDYSREALIVHPDYSIPSIGVISQLEMLAEHRDLPSRIRVDNGPEFTSIEFTQWCEKKKIQIIFIQPGKPTQNAYIERLNKTYRNDILNAYLFETLEEVRILSDEWLWTYNHELPHGSINDMTPYEYSQLAVNSGKLPAHNAIAEFTTINSHNNSNSRNNGIEKTTISLN